MQDKSAGGIYAIEDEAVKVEAIESMSTFSHIESLDDFLKSVHCRGNDDDDRYYVCVAPAAWAHCVENRSGASSPVDAAKEMIELLSEGWPIYVWDSLAKLAYRFDPTPYIFDAIESKKVEPEPLTTSSSPEKVSQASGVDAALAELYQCEGAARELGRVWGSAGALRDLLELRHAIAAIIENDTDSEAYMISRICKRLGIAPPTFAPGPVEDGSNAGLPAAGDEELDDYAPDGDRRKVYHELRASQRIKASVAAEEALTELVELQGDLMEIITQPDIDDTDHILINICERLKLEPPAFMDSGKTR